MKIILITSVSGLGKVGDVIEVKNGYARNFLIPNKKAVFFTPLNYKTFEAKKAEFEKENQKSFEVASSLKSVVEGKDITIIENTSDDGRLYGSVNSLVIAAKINEMVGKEVASRSNVSLKKPIKEVGIFEVSLNLHSDVTVKVRLVVARSESEVSTLLKKKEA